MAEITQPLALVDYSNVLLYRKNNYRIGWLLVRILSRGATTKESRT